MLEPLATNPKLNINLNRKTVQVASAQDSPDLVEQTDPQGAPPTSLIAKAKSLFETWAPIIHSREMSYRVVLDVIASDVPKILAAAMRNTSSLVEAFTECAIQFVIGISAPNISRVISQIIGKKMFSPEEHKDIDNYIRFETKDLIDQASFEKGLSRIAHDEADDERRFAELYKKMGSKPEKVNGFLDKARGIENFCERISYSKELADKIYNLKRKVMLYETMIEGFCWANIGTAKRFVRENILNKKRFTGTLKYLKDKESKKLGDAGTLKGWQKIGLLLNSFTSPVLNGLLQSLGRNAKGDGWLATIRDQIDMSHGTNPKLGLVFSSIAIPKFAGLFISSQGRYELLENIITFITIIPSFLMGDRATGGRMARAADKKLAEKYGIEPGILVKPGELNKTFPDQARFDHVWNRIKDHPSEELKKEAKSLYNSSLFKGFWLHSAMVFAVIFANQQLTKLRALFDLKKLKK